MYFPIFANINLIWVRMKRIFVSLLALLFVSTNVKAQVTVEEPEFAEQTLLLTSDSDGVLLKRESGTIVTKAGASLYLTGIGKVKSRLTLQGPESVNSVKGGATTRLIVKALDNRTDPNSFVNIFKFDVYNNEERRYQVAEVGTLSKAETNNLSSVEYKAKKYGESSYLITMEGLTSGQYGIVLGDPNTENTKNSLKVTTFAVSSPIKGNVAYDRQVELPHRGVITKTSGLVMDVMVYSVEDGVIKYKKLRKQDGEMLEIDKDKVQKIDYK